MASASETKQTSTSKSNVKKASQQKNLIIVNSDELDNINITNDIQPTATINVKPKILKKKNTNLINQITDIQALTLTSTPTTTAMKDDNINETVNEDNIKAITNEKPINKINKINKLNKAINPIKNETDIIITDNQEILLELDKDNKDNKDNKDKTKIKNKHPVKKNNVLSTELFNDEELDYRTILMNYDFTKNITKPKITKYEKALLVGKRAKQLEEGANANVKVLAGQSMIDVAEEELRQRLMPFMIKRPIGNLYEYWRIKDMEVNMD